MFQHAADAVVHVDVQLCSQPLLTSPPFCRQTTSPCTDTPHTEPVQSSSNQPGCGTTDSCQLVESVYNLILTSHNTLSFCRRSTAVKFTAYFNLLFQVAKKRRRRSLLTAVMLSETHFYHYSWLTCVFVVLCVYFTITFYSSHATFLT